MTHLMIHFFFQWVRVRVSIGTVVLITICYRWMSYNSNDYCDSSIKATPEASWNETNIVKFGLIEDDFTKKLEMNYINIKCTIYQEECWKTK